MGYADKNLAPGETILYRARYHWVFYRLLDRRPPPRGAAFGVAACYSQSAQAGKRSAAAAPPVAAGFVVVALVAFLARRFRASLDEFVVTNRRVIRKVGLFAREIQQAPLEKVQDITVEQGAFGRMLGYGTVIVETASEKGMLVFPRSPRRTAFATTSGARRLPKTESASAVQAPAAAGVGAGASGGARKPETAGPRQPGGVRREAAGDPFASMTCRRLAASCRRKPGRAPIVYPLCPLSR